MEDQNDGFAEDDNIAEDLERAFADEPIRQDDDDDDDDESTHNYSNFKHASRGLNFG